MAAWRPRSELVLRPSGAERRTGRRRRRCRAYCQPHREDDGALREVLEWECLVEGRRQLAGMGALEVEPIAIDQGDGKAVLYPGERRRPGEQAGSALGGLLGPVEVWEVQTYDGPHRGRTRRPGGAIRPQAPLMGIRGFIPRGFRDPAPEAAPMWTALPDRPLQSDWAEA